MMKKTQHQNLDKKFPVSLQSIPVELLDSHNLYTANDNIHVRNMTFNFSEQILYEEYLEKKRSLPIFVTSINKEKDIELT